ncbi:MAG: HDIG domain-containing protein [Elusimicrobia bacterium]|nr:HDIG domain-containing protein [Elusimicrobiota bacterium]
MSQRKLAPMRLNDESIRLLREAARIGSGSIFLVGGAIRDILLQRPWVDLDLACRRPEALSRRLASAFGGKFVTLDAKEGVYRVALPASFRQVRRLDVARLQGPGILQDLARRDFTVNALAVEISSKQPATLEPSKVIDPRGGLRDIKGRLLRAESADLFESDPLRLLRAFRFASQLGFNIEAGTLKHIRRCRSLARKPTGERIQAELGLLLGNPGASEWLKRMDECSLLTALLPELEPERACATVYYGSGGVLRHSLDTASRADFLFHNLSKVFPDHASALSAELERPFGAATRKSVLMLGALLHDIAKPATARKVGGRLRFFGHDQLGARQAAELLRELRFPGEVVDTLSTVIAHHLRPGNLAASGMITDKAAYRFFRDLGPRALDLLLVCWADHASYLPHPVLLKHLGRARLEPQGPEGRSLSRIKPVEARKTIYHLQVVSHLLKKLLAPGPGPLPRPIVNGHEVMKALKLQPGPRIGQLLEKVREAQALGEVKTKKQALELLREHR